MLLRTATRRVCRCTDKRNWQWPNRRQEFAEVSNLARHSKWTAINAIAALLLRITVLGLRYAHAKSSTMIADKEGYQASTCLCQATCHMAMTPSRSLISIGSATLVWRSLTSSSCQIICLLNHRSYNLLRCNPGFRKIYCYTYAIWQIRRHILGNASNRTPLDARS